MKRKAKMRIVRDSMTPTEPSATVCWAPEDRKVLRRLVGGYLLTTLLPRRLDSWLVPKLIRMKVPATRFEPWPGMTEVERRMRFVLEPHRPALDFRALAAHFDEMRVELDWLRARSLHLRGPHVDTTVEGREQLPGLGESPRAGEGVVLWGMSFCGTLVVKTALSRAGIPLVHLSGVGHGGSFPPTRFGLRIVSPLYCRAENRFLAERVLIPVDGSLGYLRTLIDRLERGHVVYLAGERRATRRNTRVPCLGRPTEFARGAPGLAYRTGSPLLPVTVYRTGVLSYRVVIEEPVDVDRSLPRDEFIHEAIVQFAERVGRNVLEHPSDWDWYRHTVPQWENETLGAGAA